MLFLPYKRGNKKYSYFYLIIFVLIILVYIFSPESQDTYQGLYFLVFSQIVFSLGLYCLVPKILFKNLDIDAFSFVFVPLLISIIASIIIAILLGSNLTDILNGNINLIVYWISFLIGLISTLILFNLLTKRAKEYKTLMKSIHETTKIN
jgi:hypothetical protein